MAGNTKKYAETFWTPYTCIYRERIIHKNIC